MAPPLRRGFRRPLAALCLAALAAGCGSLPDTQGGRTLIPDEGEVRVASDLSYTTKELVMAPVAMVTLGGIFKKSLDELLVFKQPILLYFVYQPFAPNWSLEEAKLNDDTYYLRMQAKRFRTGGDGEAMLLLKRRAQQLQLERGYAGYRIVDYSEGIESDTLSARRYSHGVVLLVRADDAATQPSAR
ncbi:MAG: hypothetical protein H3C26_19330 [Rhodocyclaceae bacterium]|nr:hypothetical protein [Rhodocyclaceae bacterium]